MIVLSILLIIALILFFVAFGSIIAGAMGIVQQVKRIKGMTEPSKNSGMELFNTVQGIGVRSLSRFKVIGGHGQRAFVAVKDTAETIGTAAKSVDVKQARSSVQQAKTSVANLRQLILTIKQFTGLYNQVKQTTRR